ncbi:MAG: amidohydrolase [Bacteroidetes bacterium]|nr:amidohydrolase [Bacteroidota bacterium]
MNDLKITIVQSDLVWENPTQNLSNFDKKIDAITDQPDIIVLPETFNTAFSINPEKCSEIMEGNTVKWMHKKAFEKNAVIVGSLLVNENGKIFNRIVWMQPDGSCFTYDKRHLFRMSDEYKLMNGGLKRKVINYNGWNINLLICYDLRFPVWSKNTYKEGKYEFDLIIYAANWPAARSHIWQTLLKARAIENQAYVIGVNRIGKDGAGTDHTGDSMIIDPMGNVLQQAKPSEEETLSVILSKNFLQEFRNKFTVGLDWDNFSLQS